MLTLLLLVVAMAALDDLLLRWAELRGTHRAAGVAGLLTLLVLLGLSLPQPTVLEKAAGRLAMPTGLLFFAAMVLGIHAVRRRARLGAILLVLWLFYTAAGNEWIGGALLAELEEPYVDTDYHELEPFDAVFVLGGGVQPTHDGFGQLTESGDRVVLAARLHHLGIARRLFASGHTVPGMGEEVEGAHLTEQIWWSLGVPHDAIELVFDAHNTSMEVEAYAEVVRERGFERVALLSSAWHLRRVMHLAREEGLEATPIAADRRGWPEWKGLPSAIPTGPGFAAVHRASWELLGEAVGR